MNFFKKHKMFWIIFSLILSVMYVLFVSYIFFFERYVTNPFEKPESMIIEYYNKKENLVNSFTITNQELVQNVSASFPMIHFPKIDKEGEDCSEHEFYVVFIGSSKIDFNPNVCSTKKMVNGRLTKLNTSLISTKILIPKEFANRIIDIVNERKNIDS